jgi:hypothetical protein
MVGRNGHATKEDQIEYERLYSHIFPALLRLAVDVCNMISFDCFIVSENGSFVG